MASNKSLIAVSAVALLAISSTEARSLPPGSTIYNPNPIRPILYDEEEWQVNAGISGSGGRPSWNVGVSHSWEEDQELQKIKIVKNLKKAANVLVKADQLGLLEEDVELDEVQKLKLGKVITGAVKVVKVAGAVGLLEDDSELDAVQKFHLGKSLDKALNIAGKAKQIGLFDEEEWTVNGGISGGAGGRPQWQVGVSHSWEEEQGRHMGGQSPFTFDESELVPTTRPHHQVPRTATRPHPIPRPYPIRKPLLQRRRHTQPTTPQ